MATKFSVSNSTALDRIKCDGHEHVIRISETGDCMAMVREEPMGRNKRRFTVQAVRNIRRRSTGKKQAEEMVVTMFALQLATFL